ncbi:MAG: zinc-dependent metalloprotease [Pseudobacter sp.]|uniref:zinc-dependent metalloprotease n=1 Tax=Pseudobacter sp. TaxID=2045420 RepID=UPI003F81BFB6
MSKKVLKHLTGGLLMAMLCAQTSVVAQQRERRRANNNMPAPNADTSQKRDNNAALRAAAALAGGMRNDGPKPYKEVITAKAVSYKSFISVHKVDEKYYLEVPDSLLEREILVINRIAMAPADFRRPGSSFGYAGDIIGQQVFHFTKGEGNRLFIRTKNYKERSTDSSANGLARLIGLNNMESIVNSFVVKAINDNEHTKVIEITDLLGQDNNLFGFSQTAKSAGGLGNILSDRSYIDKVKGQEDNLSFTFMRTYNRTAPGSSTTAPFTFQLGTGMILLPEVPMKARFADSRTAFQNIGYIDFDNNPRGVVNTQMIVRWRLEPSDKEAYAAGKLSSPVQAIRIYLDPAMPAKWKPFVKAGIESWNKAFESAGFKNAIEVLQDAAGADNTALDNINRSAVVFMPGTGKSQGSMILDPRSGEVLRVQLNFYLSTLDSLCKKYFVQAGALDQAANKPVFDDPLMGRLIQAYSMQSMGNLLGLKVNAGASFSNMISDLRNNAWLSKNAFNGSATDPVLVNYVVQPEDKVEVNNLLPRITATDEWMINWGYRMINGNEQPILNKWIKEQIKPSAERYIGEAPAGFTIVADPRNQSGDLSNDAVQAATLGINNLKRVVPHLVEWTSEPATNNTRAGELYEALLDQYTIYAKYVLNQIGGMYSNIRNSDQPGNIYAFVPVAVQKKALQFLQQQVFETPTWLSDKTLYSRTSWRFDSVMNIQRALLSETLSRPVLSKLQVAASNESGSAYTPLAFLNELSAGIFRELNNNAAITLPRRELQQEYITRLIALNNAFPDTDNDLPAVISAHARKMLSFLKQKQMVYTGLNQAHITAMYERLNSGINKTTTAQKK